MNGFIVFALLAALLLQASCRQTNHRFSRPHLGPYLQSQEDSFPMQPHHAYSRLRHFRVHPEITPTVNSKENGIILGTDMTLDISQDQQQKRIFPTHDTAPKPFHDTAPKPFQMTRGQQTQYSPESYSPESYSPESYSPESYSPESYSPESYSPESYSPEQTQVETFYFLPFDATRKAETGYLFLNEDSLFREQYQPELMFSGAQTE